MNPSATQERIGNIVMQSSLAVYGIVWLVGLALWLKGAWILASITAATYVAMHAFEMIKRGHCWTSADSTALPVSAVVHAIAVAVLGYLEYPPLVASGYLNAFFAYAGVLICGHVAVLAHMGITENLFLRVFRKRIAAEKQEPH